MSHPFRKMSTTARGMKKGDIIEIDRGWYRHWGIYVGDGQMVHLTGPPASSSAASPPPPGDSNPLLHPDTCQATVTKDDVIAVAAGDRIRVNNQTDIAAVHGWTSRADDVIVADCLEHVARTTAYNVYDNNGEHFVTRMRYGLGWDYKFSKNQHILRGLASGGDQGNAAPPMGFSDVIRQHMEYIDAATEGIIGMDDLKEQMKDLMVNLLVGNLRRGSDQPAEIKRPVIVLMGNPGTGKKTLAQLLADILYRCSYVDSPQMTVVGPNELLSLREGQSITKTSAAIDRARHKTMVVDHIINIVGYDVTGQGPGIEALETIMDTIEGDPDVTSTNRPAYIFTGYIEQMEWFLGTHPDFKKRITHTFQFPDFNLSELIDILFVLARAENFTINMDKSGLLDLLVKLYEDHPALQENATFCKKLLSEAKARCNARVLECIKEGKSDVEIQACATTLTEQDMEYACAEVASHSPLDE